MTPHALANGAPLPRRRGEALPRLPPDRQNIPDGVAWLRRRAAPDDVVTIFIYSHGGQEYCFMPAGYREGKPGAAVRGEEVCS
jgi:hypothetical protein